LTALTQRLKLSFGIGVLSFFPIPSSLLDPEQQKRAILPNSTVGIVSGAKLWLPVAVRLETDATMRSGCFSIHRRPWLKSAATETRRVMPLSEQSFKIDDPALSQSIGLRSVTNKGAESRRPSG
jgi:hypothetical protein